MSAQVVEEVFEFDQKGRMKWHPDYHAKQGKPWSVEELEYLCVFYEHDEIRTLSFSLERTEVSIRHKYSELSRSGLVEEYRRNYFRKLGG